MILFSNNQYLKLEALLEDVKWNQGLIKRKLERIMHTLDDVLADVAEESSKIDSLTVFIAGLKQQIADALAGVTLPPAVQAKVDAVFDAVEVNKGKVVTAMDANVPPAPEPPPQG
jgi:hypothetical protein